MHCRVYINKGRCAGCRHIAATASWDDMLNHCGLDGDLGVPIVMPEEPCGLLMGQAGLAYQLVCCCGRCLSAVADAKECVISYGQPRCLALVTVGYQAGWGPGCHCLDPVIASRCLLSAAESEGLLPSKATGEMFFCIMHQGPL